MSRRTVEAITVLAGTGLAAAAGGSTPTAKTAGAAAIALAGALALLEREVITLPARRPAAG